MPSNTPTSRALGQMELAEREGLGSKLGVPYALQGLAAVAGRAARRSRAELPRGAGAGGPGGLVRALVSGAIWARAGPEGSWSAPRRSHYAPAGTGPLRACRPGRTVGTGMTQTEPRSCRRLPRWSLTASGWLILPRGHERRRQMASRGTLPDPLHGFEGTAAIQEEVELGGPAVPQGPQMGGVPGFDRCTTSAATPMFDSEREDAPLPNIA